MVKYMLASKGILSPDEEYQLEDPEAKTQQLRVDILDVVSSFGVVSIVLLGLLILIPCIILFIIGLKLAFRNSYVINKITMYILLAIWILSFMYFFYLIGIELITNNFPYNL